MNKVAVRYNAKYSIISDQLSDSNFYFFRCYAIILRNIVDRPYLLQLGLANKILDGAIILAIGKHEHPFPMLGKLAIVSLGFPSPGLCWRPRPTSYHLEPPSTTTIQSSPK